MQNESAVNLIPKVGQTAIIRNRPAIIREVTESKTTEKEIIHGVLVEYIDGFTHPVEDFVLWEREIRTELLSNATIPNPSKLDHPDVFHAFINAYRWSSINRIDNLISGNNTEQIVSPWLSAVQIEDYQLYPVLKSLVMPRITMLLADDVGLGKTIEAGLIINELVARGRLRRILIVCPASLQIQWRDEMAEKFSLQFAVVNRETTQELQKEYGIDSNPWSFHPRIITSVDYLRQKDVQESFESASRAFSLANSASTSWEMLIIDEAHNIAPKHFGEDTDRLKMIRQIIPYFEHRLFLTATPHNGFTESFTGLLEVLNPLVFEQKSRLENSDIAFIKQYVVRRLKSDFKNESAIQRFCDRKIERINPNQRLFETEKNLFDALRKYRQKALNIVEGETGSKRFIVGFLITLLTKRLLSSHYAFACTWWNHFAGFQETEIEQNEVSFAIDRAESEITDDNERDLREEEAVKKIGTWFSRHTKELSKEIESINAVLEILGWSAKVIEGNLTNKINDFQDSKWQGLEEWITKNLIQDKKFREDERVIIFTEYKHTLDYLVKRLELKGYRSPILQTLVGGSSSSEREEVKQHFNDSSSPLRILLVTDVASEGINLQNNCRYIIHYEIPWNPMRLEQRNGRVDRFGQARDVTVFHYVTEDEEDFKFLERVVHKVEQIREDLGKVSELLDKNITRYFIGAPSEREAANALFENISPSSRDQGLMATPDKGSKEKYNSVIQQLRASEMELHLNPIALAELLTKAMEYEGGKLALHPDEEGVYLIQTTPPGWRTVIERSLQIKSGKLSGSLPRLVFDSAFFQKIINGRLQYITKPDTRLIRLSHPIMRKAVNLFKKSLWDITSSTNNNARLSRFAVSSATLPQGMYEVVVFYVLQECYNELRENIHQEVLEIPFLINGKSIEPVISEIWSQIHALPVYSLSPLVLQEWMPKITSQWTVVEEYLLDLLKTKKKTFLKDITKQLASSEKKDNERTKKSYQQRLEELKKRKEAVYIDRIRKELSQEQQSLQQVKLFAELERDRINRLKEIEANLDQLVGAKSDYLQGVLELEMNRLLDIVIPRRYAIGYFEMQPLGVEVILNSNILGDGK